MKVIYYSLLFFSTAFSLVHNTYAKENIIVAKNDNDFVQTTIDDLKNILMNSTLSTKEKVDNLKKTFDKYFDTEYIKNRSISMIKRSSKFDKLQETRLKNAVMEYLFYKYVKITSDYKNVDINIKSIQTSGKIKFANCEIISRGKEMKFRLQIANKNGEYKIQGIIFENVDLTSPEGFYRKYNEECNKNLDKFIQQLSDMAK